MAEPFIGEVRITSFDLVPSGWMLCNGAELQINQYSALYSIIGTKYGGNGTTTFKLPHFAGRIVRHPSPTVALGSSGGAESHTLLPNEMPGHNHTARVAGAATTPAPTGAAWAASDAGMYGPVPATTTMAADALSHTGGSQSHPNMAPYLVLNFIIAVIGMYPPRD